MSEVDGRAKEGPSSSSNSKREAEAAVEQDKLREDPKVEFRYGIWQMLLSNLSGAGAVKIHHILSPNPRPNFAGARGAVSARMPTTSALTRPSAGA